MLYNDFSQEKLIGGETIAVLSFMALIPIMIDININYHISFNSVINEEGVVMLSKKWVKILCLLLPFFANFTMAKISSCEVEKKLASQTVSIGEHTYRGVIVSVDATDIELWTRQCDDRYELLATITPKIAGKSKVTGFSEVAIVQGNNQSSKGSITLDENLYVPESYLIDSNYISSNEGIDYSKPVKIYMICEKLCSGRKVKEIDLVPNNDTNTNTTQLSSVTGTWYDPAYDGSGFNVVEATNGLFMYFYGYKAEENGQAQWLLSAVGPKAVTKGQAIELTVYEPTEGNGANFLTKPASGSGVSEWGKVSLTFNSCASGTIVLDGKDGKVTHNVVKLANIKNLTCTE